MTNIVKTNRKNDNVQSILSLAFTLAVVTISVMVSAQAGNKPATGDYLREILYPIPFLVFGAIFAYKSSNDDSQTLWKILSVLEVLLCIGTGLWLFAMYELSGFS